MPAQDPLKPDDLFPDSHERTRGLGLDFFHLPRPAFKWDNPAAGDAGTGGASSSNAPPPNMAIPLMKALKSRDIEAIKPVIHEIRLMDLDMQQILQGAFVLLLRGAANRHNFLDNHNYLGTLKFWIEDMHIDQFLRVQPVDVNAIPHNLLGYLAAEDCRKLKNEQGHFLDFLLDLNLDVDISFYEDAGDRRGESSFCALTWAVMVMKPRLVRKVLSLGANPNGPRDLGYRSKTPLAVLAHKCMLLKVGCDRAREDVLQQFRLDDNLLNVARVLKRYRKLGLLLLEAGARPEGTGILQSFATGLRANDDVDFCGTMIENHGVDVNDTRLIFDGGPSFDPNLSVRFELKPAVWEAMLNNWAPMVELLLKHGARMDFRDENRFTALQTYFIKLNIMELRTRLCWGRRMLLVLLNAGIDRVEMPILRYPFTLRFLPHESNQGNEDDF